MGVYSAYLTIDDYSIWLRNVAMSIDRTLDDEFKLVPESTMIKLTMLFSPTTNPGMQTWMTSPGQKRDGAVVYLNPEGNPVRVTRFSGGCCQHVGQDYDHRPDAPLPVVTRLVVEAQSISIDQPESFTYWPPVALN